jgi:D-glycero-D-manno-heptose 1,7-bisphosphate phosphatase
MLRLDLAASILVGDAESDLLAARAAGCWPVMVRTGRGAAQIEQLRQAERDGFVAVEDLGAAVDWILSRKAVFLADR